MNGAIWNYSEQIVGCKDGRLLGEWDRNVRLVIEKGRTIKVQHQHLEGWKTEYNNLWGHNLEGYFKDDKYTLNFNRDEGFMLFDKDAQQYVTFDTIKLYLPYGLKDYPCWEIRSSVRNDFSN